MWLLTVYPHRTFGWLPSLLPTHILILSFLMIQVLESAFACQCYCWGQHRKLPPSLYGIFLTLIDEYNILPTIIMNLIYMQLWKGIVSHVFLKNFCTVGESGKLWYYREQCQILFLVLKYSLPLEKTSQHFPIHF